MGAGGPFGGASAGSIATEMAAVTLTANVTTVTEVSNVTSVDTVDTLTEVIRAGEPYLIAVARGAITGRSATLKFGINTDVDDATFEDMWDGGGTYTGFNATAGQAIEVLSGSGADTGTVLSSGTGTGGSSTTFADTGATFSTDTVAAGDIVINDTQSDHMIVTSLTETVLTGKCWRHGTTPAASDAYRVATPGSTGAAVVRLPKCLDSTWAESVEYVVLNGATPVDTAGTDYIRSSRVRVVLAGSGLGNAGIITTRQTTTTANVFGIMIIGYNSSMVACDTVPAGKQAYILGWFGGLNGNTQADCAMRLLARPTGEPFQVQDEGSLRGAGTSSFPKEFGTPNGPWPAGTDIKIEGNSDANNTSIAASFDLLLVDV